MRKSALLSKLAFAAPLLLALSPSPAMAQAAGPSITSAPLSAISIPLGGPCLLSLLSLALLAAGWWLLRRGHRFHHVLPMLVLSALSGVIAFSPALQALAVATFTNPAGETLPIAINPHTTTEGTASFNPDDFTNASGAALKISSIVPPTFDQCFPAGSLSDLLTPGEAVALFYPACTVGMVLQNGSSCTVDVNTICRALAGSVATLASVTPGSGTASGGTGVTLTGTNLSAATGVTFDGVAATSVHLVNATTVTAVTPAHAVGAVDVIVATPNGKGLLAGGYTYLTTAVGQSSGGGVIAALGGGLNNLIAATADNGAAIQWGGLGTATGATSTTDGASNTVAIISALGAGTYAAEVCANYEVDSQGNAPCQTGNACYNDWFLPAQSQLNALYTNRVLIGGFTSSSYWASTEYSLNPSSLAWTENFGTGLQSTASKSTLLGVRCARAFTP